MRWHFSRHRPQPGGGSGLPAAIAVKLVLAGELKMAGSHIPIKPEIYNPILQELAGLGMTFQEKVTVNDTMKR